MPRRVLMLTLLLALPLGGCIKKQLRHPAEDHRVQARAVADSCEVDGMGAGKCTQEDVDHMAIQAECIDAIVKGMGARCGADAEGAGE